MTWTKIADEFLEDDTIAALSDKSFRLFVSSLVYCSRNLTDGVLTPKSINVMQAILGYRVAKYAAELVRAGLWTEDGERGFMVRNYLKYNRESEAVKDDRRKARDRMARRRSSSERSAEPSGERSAEPREKFGRTFADPDPTRPESEDTAAAGSTPDAKKTDAAAALTQLGITDPDLVDAANNDPERALACATAAQTRATKNPAGLYRRIFDSGDWPTTDTNTTTTNGDFDQNADRPHPCGLPNCPLRFHTADEAEDHRRYAHLTTNGTTNGAAPDGWSDWDE